MALFERIKGEFFDQDGLDYTIRIYKEEISESGSHTFKVGGEGFIHEYYTDEEELWSWIKYGKVTIPLIVEDATDLGIINEILQGDEGDFYVKITKNSDTDIYFQGIVLIDQASFPNTSYPYPVYLVASDGLSLLQEKRVTTITGIEDRPFSEWLQTILDQFNFGTFGSFDLWTSFRLWNDYTLSYNNSSTSRDPLVYMYVDPKNFVYSDKNGRRDFMTYGDVLKELCQFLHCNLFYSDGKYWFVSLYERLGTTLEMVKYDDAYVFNSTVPNLYSSTGVSYDGAVSHTFSFATNSVKPQGGLFRTKPAAYKVREPNSAEGSFKSGQISGSIMNYGQFQPTDSGTGGALNVPETPLVRVADIRQGIEEVTIKGVANWKVRQENPPNQNPTKDAKNRNLIWKMRNFFVQKNSTAYNINYGSENVYNGFTQTWTTGPTTYAEIELGNVNGTSSTYNQDVGWLLQTALTTDNITEVVVYSPSQFSAALAIEPTGWIRVEDDAAASRWLHYTAYSIFGVGGSATARFTIDTTSGDEDFATVNASVDNVVDVVQETEVIYKEDFEVTVKNFPSDENLFWSFIMIGEDYNGNKKAYPINTYEYLTQPTAQEFDVIFHRGDYRVFANQDVDDISDFEFVTVNNNNAGYSYEIILPESKILEKDDDFYGNDTNWLKVFPASQDFGVLQLTSPRPAGKEWSDTIAAGDSLVRRINHDRLLEMTAEPYYVLETAFKSNLSFYRRLNWDSKNWIFSSGTFYANEVQWEAVLIQLQNTSTTTGNESTVAARVSPTGAKPGDYSTSRRASDVGQFDFLALTDGTTAQGATTSISVRDPRTMNVPTDTALIIYNPQTGDSDDIVLSADWTGEGSTTISIDAVSLSADYPDGSLIQIKPHQFIDYTQRVLTLNQAATSNPNDVSVPRTSYIFTTNGSYTLPTAATFTTALIDTIDLINQSGVNITVNLNAADTLYQGSEDGVLLYPNSVITLRVTDTTEFTII